MAPTWDVPVLFSISAYNLTLNGPHFTIFYLFCCSSSTNFLKPESGGSILALNHNIFMLPKVQQVRPKGPPFGFFSALCNFFSKIFGFYQRVTPCFFLSFRFVKTFNEPEWPLFEFFGIVRLSKKNTFFEKKIQKIFFEKNFSKCFQ